MRSCSTSAAWTRTPRSTAARSLCRRSPVNRRRGFTSSSRPPSLTRTAFIQRTRSSTARLSATRCAAACALSGWVLTGGRPGAQLNLVSPVGQGVLPASQPYTTVVWEAPQEIEYDVSAAAAAACSLCCPGPQRTRAVGATASRKRQRAAAGILDHLGTAALPALPRERPPPRSKLPRRFSPSVCPLRAPHHPATSTCCRSALRWARTNSTGVQPC